MSLIQCPECRHTVSDMAVRCPNCGHPIAGQKGNSKANKASSSKVFLTTGVAAIIVCFLWILSDYNVTKKYGVDLSYSASNKLPEYNYQYEYVPKVGNEGALAKAKSYLKSSAFSYTGLIDQLEYEGFSTSEATYGANNCGADWNEQALKKAKSYLKSSSFSHTGLIDQLEFEGFTGSEAKYGVENCGADWNEQAVKKAKSYMKSFSDWTRSQLIDQLEFEGFTYSQAVYGANNCGI